MTAAERNRLKHRLAGGQLGLVSGNYETPDMIDLAGSLGVFDGVWIDMEHGAAGVESLADLSRAADVWGLTSLVRVAALDAAAIGLALSQGVDGVIVPHVTTRDQAELAVEAAKFPPAGRRGAAGGRRSYGRTVAEHQEQANRETLVAVMIEDAAAVENLPAILTVQQVDLLFVGRYDLAQSLGLGSDVRHPKVVTAFDGAIESIVAAGRVAGAVVGEEELEKYLALGVRCIKTPTWQSYISAGARLFGERARGVRL
ncbi:MAG: aldolase [Candidatus Nephthysia bennettiae]|uniref:Aldolase n=1 Tax=Candidatus Nephthysia bennettiae TaxID=3127016 RepID=A0A934NEF9_9BACT|nr:aldolase [Candidatus Dormibacteraeota bacterium]MBJ7614030.1 aldolase [Candidatus Dormibacteraeota bacterium]PZR90126.1 MAG: aldolase [Candidatus Dormibacteraeota bacterium]